MKIIVRSRFEAERQVKQFFSPAFAVISITDPDTPDARVDEHVNCTGVLRLRFHDIEPSRYSVGEFADFTPMHVGHAERVWKFIQDQWLRADTLLIHCEAGASRSPSLAMAIADAYALGRDAINWGGDSSKDPPNGHVYDTTIQSFPGITHAIRPGLREGPSELA